jgi:hypothetical protein
MPKGTRRSSLISVAERELLRRSRDEIPIKDHRGNPSWGKLSKAKICIDNVTVFEGQLARFTVTLSKPHDQTVTVEFYTSDGMAIAPEDYRAKTRTLSFPPGATSRRGRRKGTQRTQLISSESGSFHH